MPTTTPHDIADSIIDAMHDKIARPVSILDAIAVMEAVADEASTTLAALREDYERGIR